MTHERHSCPQGAPAEKSEEGWTLVVTKIARDGQQDMSRASAWWALNRAALEAATGSDREFFEGHPDALSRERDFVIGELPFPSPPPGHVIRVRVTRLGAGIRTREIFTRRKKRA